MIKMNGFMNLRHCKSFVLSGNNRRSAGFATGNILKAGYAPVGLSRPHALGESMLTLRTKNNGLCNDLNYIQSCSLSTAVGIAKKSEIFTQTSLADQATAIVKINSLKQTQFAEVLKDLMKLGVTWAALPVPIQQQGLSLLLDKIDECQTVLSKVECFKSGSDLIELLTIFGNAKCNFHRDLVVDDRNICEEVLHTIRVSCFLESDDLSQSNDIFSKLINCITALNNSGCEWKLLSQQNQDDVNVMLLSGISDFVTKSDRSNSSIGYPIHRLLNGAATIGIQCPPELLELILDSSTMHIWQILQSENRALKSSIISKESDKSGLIWALATLTENSYISTLSSSSLSSPVTVNETNQFFSRIYSSPKRFHERLIDYTENVLASLDSSKPRYRISYLLRHLQILGLDVDPSSKLWTAIENSICSMLTNESLSTQSELAAIKSSVLEDHKISTDQLSKFLNSIFEHTEKGRGTFQFVPWKELDALTVDDLERRQRIFVLAYNSLAAEVSQYGRFWAIISPGIRTQVLWSLVTVLNEFNRDCATMTSDQRIEVGGFVFNFIEQLSVAKFRFSQLSIKSSQLESNIISCLSQAYFPVTGDPASPEIFSPLQRLQNGSVIIQKLVSFGSSYNELSMESSQHIDHIISSICQEFPKVCDQSGPVFELFLIVLADFQVPLSDDMFQLLLRQTTQHFSNRSKQSREIILPLTINSSGEKSLLWAIEKIVKIQYDAFVLNQDGRETIELHGFLTMHYEHDFAPFQAALIAYTSRALENVSDARIILVPGHLHSLGINPEVNTSFDELLTSGVDGYLMRSDERMKFGWVARPSQSIKKGDKKNSQLTNKAPGAGLPPTVLGLEKELLVWIKEHRKSDISWSTVPEKLRRKILTSLHSNLNMIRGDTFKLPLGSRQKKLKELTVLLNRMNFSHFNIHDDDTSVSKDLVSKLLRSMKHAHFMSPDEYIADSTSTKSQSIVASQAMISIIQTLYLCNLDFLKLSSEEQSDLVEIIEGGLSSYLQTEPAAPTNKSRIDKAIIAMDYMKLTLSEEHLKLTLDCARHFLQQVNAVEDVKSRTSLGGIASIAIYNPKHFSGHRPDHFLSALGYLVERSFKQQQQQQQFLHPQTSDSNTPVVIDMYRGTFNYFTKVCPNREALHKEITQYLLNEAENLQKKRLTGQLLRTLQKLGYSLRADSELWPTLDANLIHEFVEETSGNAYMMSFNLSLHADVRREISPKLWETMIQQVAFFPTTKLAQYRRLGSDMFSSGGDASNQDVYFSAKGLYFLFKTTLMFGRNWASLPENLQIKCSVSFRNLVSQQSQYLPGSNVDFLFEIVDQLSFTRCDLSKFNVSPDNDVLFDLCKILDERMNQNKMSHLGGRRSLYQLAQFMMAVSHLSYQWQDISDVAKDKILAMVETVLDDYIGQSTLSNPYHDGIDRLIISLAAVGVDVPEESRLKILQASEIFFATMLSTSDVNSVKVKALVRSGGKCPIVGLACLLGRKEGGPVIHQQMPLPAIEKFARIILENTMDTERQASVVQSLETIGVHLK